MFLPSWVVEKIHQLQTPNLADVDKLYWRHSSDGRFTVKSAYNWIASNISQNRSFLWKNIWRWPIPERVKYFMWQVLHQRIPTNSLRAERGLSDRMDCPHHCQCEETIIHTLRDCDFASTIWMSLINPIYYSVFFSGDLQVWLEWNAKNQPNSRRFMRWPWIKVFSIVCWQIWKNRCRKAFEDVSVNPSNLIHRCLHSLHEGVEDGKYRHNIFRAQERQETTWEPPPSGYIRVDVDGSVFNNFQAACGGLLRDDRGRWIAGFQRRLDPCNSTAAELSAIYNGLQVCKTRRLDKIVLYSDSLEAIHLLMTDGGTDHPLSQIIADTRALIFSDWDLQICHSYRESLRCADLMARTAHVANTELTVINSPTALCSRLILEDVS